MERSQLQYVVEVAKWQNITRAAEALHLSQPSLSNQILNLEQELGISLFERTRKRVYLTQAGESFVYQAQKILNDMDALKENMADYAKRRAGKVRVGALSVMAPLGIPEVLSAFSKQYPALQLTLMEAGSYDLVNRVKMNELDAAFVILFNAEKEEELYQIKLLESDLMAVVHIDDPLAQRKELILKDLEEQRLIVSTENYNMQRLILSQLDQRNIPYQIAASCNQVETCFRLVDEGFGISYSSRETSLYYKYDHVRCILIRDVPARPVYLVYKKRPEYHPALRAFVSFVQEWYQ